MNLLLLAGSGESRAIATALKGVSGLGVRASLAGRTKRPMALDCPTRIGGFGGAEGFRGYLCQEKIDAVLDATHPFATRMSATAATVCHELGCAHLQLLRPPWREDPVRPWLHATCEADAARHIPPGATVFLATGPARIRDFANLQGRHLICRRIDSPKHPFPFPNGQYMVARPPFDVAEEKALFQELGVDCLVLRNAGGAPSRPKLDAAMELGLKVVMIDRPAPLDCARCNSVSAALDWVRARLSDVHPSDVRLSNG